MHWRIQEKICFEDQRISFPEPFRQRLADYCKRELLDKEIKYLKETNADLEEKSKNISQEINETQKYNEDLERKIKAIQARKHEIKKDIAQRTPKKPTPQQENTGKNQELTGKEKMNCLKSLKNKYSARERTDLFERLDNDAIKAYRKKSKNFHSDLHIWRGAINSNYKFVFWSCHNEILYFRMNDTILLSHSFGCTKNCRNYPKQDSSSSSSSESDSSEQFKYVMLSKQEIENLVCQQNDENES